MRTWQELVRLAGSPARARTLLSHGEWWQVCRGAYVGVRHADVPEVRLAALRRVLPPGAVLSHRTALWVLGLDVLGPVIDVSVPRGRHLQPRQGVRPHTASLPDDDLCEVGGLLVVCAGRAVVDVARSEGLVEGVAVADAVLRAGHARQEDVAACLERAAGLRGVRTARDVLAAAEPRSESLMESRLRMRLVLGGVPRPVAQHDVYGPGGHVGRVDLWLDGVALEFDGRAVHLEPTAFARERRRQTGLAELGIEVRRYTALDVYRRDPADLGAEVLRAVRQARGRDRSAVRTGPDTLPAPRHRPLPLLSVRGSSAA